MKQIVFRLTCIFYYLIFIILQNVYIFIFIVIFLIFVYFII